MPLVDLAIGRLGAVTDDIAVNVHHDRGQLQSHLAGRAHVSVEAERALGTAGALGHAREWIGGRPVLVLNADAWSTVDLVDLVGGWDGERSRLLVVGDGLLEPDSKVVAALMPWSEVRVLEAVPSGLYEVSWRRSADEGRLEVVGCDGPLVDCGTPADYLRANLLTSGGQPVVSEDAVVEGTLERSVVWETGVVDAHEHLVDAIRIGRWLTVLVR